MSSARRHGAVGHESRPGADARGTVGRGGPGSRRRGRATAAAFFAIVAPMPSPLPDAVDLASVRRVLVTKLRHHGDVLLASPVFTTLRRAAPHAELDALVYRETAPMLAGHPAIAGLYTIDRDWKRQGVLAQFRAERGLHATLRARRYDLIVHLTEHPRGATLARTLKPRYAVARERPGASRWWARSFTHLYRQPLATPRHAVEANLDALRRLGVQPGEDDRRLVLVPGAAAEARADALLAQHGLGRGAFVQCHPGSRWLFKCWPAASTAALLDRIAADHAIVVTGAPDERERALVAEVLAAIAPATRSRVVDLSGALTLSELAALTSRALAFVGVDSAPMHIAAAVGTPVVVLFGPSGEREWGPWRVRAEVVASTHHACRPCGIDGCGGGKVSECLTTLPVERVHAAFMRVTGSAGA
jgi:heptosyltransferase III